MLFPRIPLSPFPRIPLSIRSCFVLCTDRDVSGTDITFRESALAFGNNLGTKKNVEIDLPRFCKSDGIFTALVPKAHAPVYQLWIEKRVAVTGGAANAGPSATTPISGYPKPYGTKVILQISAYTPAYPWRPNYSVGTWTRTRGCSRVCITSGRRGQL